MKQLIELGNTKEQIDLVFQWGSQNPQTGYYFDRQVENFRDSAMYLKKVESINGGGDNKLIIGDNYDALNNLLITHKEKIDVIYIDPPYGMNNEGEFAKTNYENKIERDSLLSMLEPRLEIAKQLLNDEGVIFCSIDDKNQAYVKLLFDRVFQNSNFISSLIWHARRGGGNDTKLVAVDHEYIIAYAKNKNSCLLIGRKKTDDDFVLQDEHLKTRGKYNLQQFDRASLTYTLTLDYPIECPDGSKLFPGHVNKLKWDQRRKNTAKRNDWRWMMSEETYKKAKENDFIVFEKKNGVWRVKVKTYQFIDYKLKKKDRLLKLRSIITSSNTQDGRKDLENLDIKSFDYPKPVKLISDLIQNYAKSNATVLDFFAGSGTTAQSVLELNKDGGKRKVFLCTNNDKDDRNPNGIAKDTTIKRLKKINIPINVYEINQAEIYSGDNSLLNLIDEVDYDLPKFTSRIKKIEWVTNNFKVTTRGLIKKP